MSKRRGDVHNWYTLPYDDREQLMLGHGATGRTFAGRVLQLVTGSTGIDDFEWGVTLFGVHPDDLKACVYTMRYDEASALFAEFGPFVTGVVGDRSTRSSTPSGCAEPPATARRRPRVSRSGHRIARIVGRPGWSMTDP